LRWLKFAKYLPEFGWQPVIYTPLNPEPQETDLSLLKDIDKDLLVLKKKIIEPYTIYKWLSGKKKDEKLGVALMSDSGGKSFMARFSLWIRSNLFIPDPRMLWIRPSVRYLRHYLKKNPVDAILTSGPPHSMHLIGRKLKKKTGIKWIADFRDPWTNIDFYNQLALTQIADWQHRRLEKKVLLQADLVLTVSPTMTREFKEAGANPVVTITNGFDGLAREPVNANREKFTILHLGSIPASRNPVGLWSAVNKLVNDYSDISSSLRIHLTGRIDQSVKNSISEYGLSEYVKYDPFVPHDQTPALMTSSSLLLLLINDTPNAKGILTNKFFEYLSSGRPILTIGPVDGDAAEILRQCNAGFVFEHKDIQEIYDYLHKAFRLNSSGELENNPANLSKYERRQLAKQLSEELNNLNH
jgi:glycosyltransferase involved in cell wall biosynthesis